MTTANLDAGDLKAIDWQGEISEDVMSKINDISDIELEFTSLVGSDTVGNDYYSWLVDKLLDPVLGGWVVDGADSDKDDSASGNRIGNHTGLLDREVRVSHRADASDTIGRNVESAYQVLRRSKEIRRSVEANALHIQGSQESAPDSGTPGIPAGFPVMADKHDTGSGGSGGVFASGLWSSWTPGTRQPLTETMLRDACQAAWEDGGDPTVAMGLPALTRGLSEYLFTSSARIATFAAETNQRGPATAMGSVNRFITDFGVVLDIKPNRLQQPYMDVSTTDPASTLNIISPAHVRLTYLRGYRVEALAKTGHSNKRLMSVDWGLKVLVPSAHRSMNDLDHTAAVTQA